MAAVAGTRIATESCKLLAADVGVVNAEMHFVLIRTAQSGLKFVYNF